VPFRAPVIAGASPDGRWARATTERAQDEVVRRAVATAREMLGMDMAVPLDEGTHCQRRCRARSRRGRRGGAVKSR